MTTKTIDATVKAALTKGEMEAARDYARGYWQGLSGVKSASAALEAAQYGKWHNVLMTGARACKDGVDRVKGEKEPVYSATKALAIYDAMDEAFCAELTSLDITARTNEGEPPPSPRKLVDIDRSYPVLRSIVRKAIEAGHRIEGNEKKADLQTAAGNVDTSKPASASSAGAGGKQSNRPKAGQGDEPEANPIPNLSPKLRAVMENIAKMVAAGLDEKGQLELAGRLLDTVEEFNAERSKAAQMAAAA